MTREIKFNFDFLFWFLILIPTFYVAGTETRAMQMEFFKISMITMLACFHANRYVGIFLGYLVFQFIFFNDMMMRSTVIPNVFFGALLYHFILKYAKIKKLYLWALWGVLLLSVFWIPIQMSQADPIWRMVNIHLQTLVTEFSGWFALPAFMGNYAAAVLPFAFLLTPYLIPFALVALFFSKSTFSVVAALIGTLFFLWFKKRIFFWVVLILFGGACAFYVIKYDLPEGQFGRRAGVWNIVLKEAFKKQFFGHGIGAYGAKYRVFEFSPSLHNRMTVDNKQLLDFISEEAKLKGENDFVKVIAGIPPDKLNNEIVFQLKNILQSKGMDFQEWMPLHNEFLQVFFDLGLIGVLIIGAYLFDLFRRFFLFGANELNLALMSSVIAILIISFGHFPFQIARLSGPFISILAFLDLSLRPKYAAD